MPHVVGLIKQTQLCLLSLVVTKTRDIKLVPNFKQARLKLYKCTFLYKVLLSQGYSLFVFDISARKIIFRHTR